jgi:hypothetical protein
MKKNKTVCCVCREKITEGDFVEFGPKDDLKCAHSFCMEKKFNFSIEKRENKKYSKLS